MSVEINEVRAALTRASPTDVELNKVLRAIRTASSPAEWRQSLCTFGPVILSDVELLVGLQTSAAELLTDDPAGAQAILRWLAELRQQPNPDFIERLLLAATSDDEIFHILEVNRPSITHEFGMRALGEIRAMCRGNFPPRQLLGALTETILHRVELIARFLDSDLLRAECHFMRSNVLVVLKDRNRSIKQLWKAAHLFEHIKSKFRQAQCIGQIGSLQLELGQLDFAEQSLLTSVGLLDPASTNDGLLAPTYEELAQIAARKADFPAAAGYYSRAGEARLRQQRLDRAAINFQASVPLLLLSNDHETAFTNTEKFLSLCEQDVDRRTSDEIDEQFMDTIARHLSGLVASSISSRNLLGPGQKPLWSIGELDHAGRWMALAKRGLTLTHQPETRAMIHFAAAVVGMNNSDPQSAAEDAAAALPFFERADDHQIFVAIVNTLAETERQLGRPEQALAVVERALVNIGGRTDPSTSLALLSQQVSALNVIGRTRDAVSALSAGLELAGQGNDARHQYYQGSLTAALGGTYQRIRQIEAAIPMQLEALRMARKVGSIVGEATQLGHLGTLCGMLIADWSNDIPVRQRWELLIRIASDGLDIALDAWQAGMSDKSLARAAASVGKKLLRRSIRSYRKVGDLAAAAIEQGNLANFTRTDKQRLGALEEALAQLRGAGGSPRSEAVLLANMGKCYMRLKKLEDARTCFEYSLSLSDSTGDCEWAYDTARELAATYLRQGMWGDGVKYLRMATDYTEAARKLLPLEDTSRVAFVRGKPEAYAQLAALYLERDRIADAFDVVQRAKSRALIDLSATGSVRPTVLITPELSKLLKREEFLLKQLRAHALVSASTVGINIERTLPDIYTELIDLYEDLRPLDPRYVAMRSGRPIQFRELKQLLGEQEREILLVDYFLQPDSILIFILRQEWDAPLCLMQEIDRSQLAAFRKDFELQVVRYRGKGPQTWTTMSSFLLGPIDEYIQVDDLIYLIPHDQLHGIPLHALPVHGVPLVESHPVVYLPAASMLPLCQAGGWGSNKLTTTCAIGVEFEEEARAVAALFPKPELLLGDLTPEDIATACAGCDVIHFSSHGYYDRVDPKKSGLVIRRQGASGPPTADAVLTSDQIIQMDLRSEVVCLSACQSGVGRLVDGDEQLGILRAFFAAGASSVISTLWPVDAEATHEFVVEFYKQLLAGFRSMHQIDKAAAFRSAQRHVLQKNGGTDAYYWAPFMLSGDWR